MRLSIVSLCLAARLATALTISPSLELPPPLPVPDDVNAFSSHRTQTSESLESPEPPASEPPETIHGELDSYMIYSTTGADPNAFLATVENLVTPQVPRVVELPGLQSENGARRVLAWVASLTDAQVEDIQRSDAVAGLEKHEEVKSPQPFRLDEDGQHPLSPARQSLHTPWSEHNLVKRAQTYNLATSDYEMIQLSTPKGREPATTYDIDSSGGAGVSVYIMDYSVLVGHEEFTTYRKRSIREFYVPAVREDVEVEINTVPYHGTCMASKAVGANLGAAPLADLVAVSLETLHLDTVLAALDLVAKDVKARGLQGKAVLVGSFGWKELADHRADLLEDALQQLIDLDVVPVVCSGNYGYDDRQVTVFPALLAEYMPLIVVGAVDSDGRRPGWSQTGPLVTTSAGGVNIHCASDTATNEYLYSQGTSFSAPVVGGMIAYWLGHRTIRTAFPKGRVAAAVKRSIQNLGWRRRPGGDKVAYNGVHECLGPNKYPPGKPRPAGNTVPSVTDLFATACPLPEPPTAKWPGPARPAHPLPPPPAKITALTPPGRPYYCYNYDQNCDGWCCPDEPGLRCSSLQPRSRGCTCGAVSEGNDKCTFAY